MGKIKKIKNERARETKTDRTRDIKKETKNPYCTRCGYKLNIYMPYLGTTKMVAIKPFVRNDAK